MTGLWTFALVVCVVALALLVRRLELRLRRVEAVQVRQLMGTAPTRKAIEEAIRGAVYDNRGGIADTIRKAMWN